MKTLFEQEIAQNTALTAFAITQAAIRFAEERKAEGIDLFAALLVPPLVYHRRTAENLAPKQMTEGLFVRMIGEDRDLVFGIQNRLMAMTSHTFSAIHLGCSSGIIRMSVSPRVQLFPMVKSLPAEVDSPKTIESVRTIFAAAKRLGYCFATTDLAVVCAALRVRF